MGNILLDTTFLLPSLGFDVKEIQAKDIETLKSASKSNMRLCCSHFSFVEIFGKLAKKSYTIDQDAVKEGIRSLLESGTYEWITPSAEALSLAFKLRSSGHVDNIDNILYSVACVSKMLFLTLDMSFKEFLAKKGFDEHIIISLKDLSVMIKQTT